MPKKNRDAASVALEEKTREIPASHALRTCRVVIFSSTRGRLLPESCRGTPASRRESAAARTGANARGSVGGTVTVGHIGDVDNYDPLTDALDQFQNYGRMMIFGSLTTYDATTQLIGDLATEWELDGTAWVFNLRNGVIWHDGSPFIADDVKYTFERALDPEAGSFPVPFNR